jgi:hypothetical protein
MDAIRCIGGPLHGKYADDVGSYLRVEEDVEPLVKYVAPLWRPLRHGPGYRRRSVRVYPKFEPRKVNRLTYVKQQVIVAPNKFVTIYAIEGLTGKRLVSTFISVYRG